MAATPGWGERYGSSRRPSATPGRRSWCWSRRAARTPSPNPSIRDLRVDLERYPEIQEAIRTERPVVIHDVHEHPLFETIRKRWLQQQLEVNVQSAVALPVFVQGRAAGVFFLRTVQGDPRLRPQDVSLATTIAQAAARVLENEERRTAIYRRQISAGVSDVPTGCARLRG